MIQAINDLTTAIQQSNSSVDWPSAISAFCSAVSLIAIILLLVERFEKKRPYLQISFELVKSSLVCLVIRNVGTEPAKLHSIKFDKDFVKQLPPAGQIHTQDRENMNISIYPGQQWVLSLNAITSTVLEYENTKLVVEIEYFAKSQHFCSRLFRRAYKENETIEFTDYERFLVYISETDELKQEIRRLGVTLKGVENSLNKLTQKCSFNIDTETYESLGDKTASKIITGYGKPVTIEKKSDTN